MQKKYLHSKLSIYLVEAKIEIFDNEYNQGKKYGSPLRPNHFLNNSESSIIGQIELINNDWMYPGKTYKTLVKFMYYPDYCKKIIKHVEWSIQFGSIKIGKGTVTEFIGFRTSLEDNK